MTGVQTCALPIYPRKKIHIGTELNMGIIAFQFGLSQLHWTAGAKFDFLFLELALSSYAVDVMPKWGMSVERRYAAQVVFKLGADGGRDSAGSEIDKQKRRRPRMK